MLCVRVAQCRYSRALPCWLETARLHNHLRDNVRVHVRRRAAVLEVAVLIGLGVPGNPHRATAVRHAVGELVDRSSLVRPCQAPLVTLAVRFDVLLMLRAKLLNGGNDNSVCLIGPIPLNALIAHFLRREVRVAPRSVPVSAARLRVERYGNLEVLAHPLHDVARHPHVVTAVDTNAWPNLVLPLPRHDFRVGAGDRESSPQALLVEGLRNDPAESNSVSAAAVVRALGASGLTLVRKAERNFLSGLEERVLLLNPEPRNLICRFRHDLQTSSALVPLHRKRKMKFRGSGLRRVY